MKNLMNSVINTGIIFISVGLLIILNQEKPLQKNKKNNFICNYQSEYKVDKNIKEILVDRFLLDGNYIVDITTGCRYNSNICKEVNIEDLSKKTKNT